MPRGRPPPPDRGASSLSCSYPHQALALDHDRVGIAPGHVAGHADEPGAPAGRPHQFLAMILPEDLPVVLASLEPALRGEGTYDAQYRITAPGASGHQALALDHDRVGIAPGHVAGHADEPGAPAQYRITDHEGRLRWLSARGSLVRTPGGGARLIGVAHRIAAAQGRGSTIGRGRTPPGHQAIRRWRSITTGTYDAQYRITDHEGRLRWLSARGSLVRTPGGGARRSRPGRDSAGSRRRPRR
jgi:hypothetical protein